jgi:hypothetical protein
VECNRYFNRYVKTNKHTKRDIYSSKEGETERKTRKKEGKGNKQK